MNTVKVSIKDDNLIISGELTQDTVMSALAQCQKLLPRGKEIEVNLSAVIRCDSASLAFLTALIRESNAKQSKLRFTNLPKQMLQIGRVSGLDSILPLAEL
ncbi:MAG: STAS domain-containing protein [Proteobacteria bacterium]|nr:STAS domain-containing protein [Pseudomonadota bacterium]